jgi:hypothetical protein
MITNISKLTLSAVVLATVSLAPAYAVETLTLSDNAGDTATGIVSSSVPGLITFAGAVGNWTLNLSAGISMPIIGSATSPAMDLISVNGFSAGPGKLSGNVLTITFTDTGFGPTTGTASTGISGTQSHGSINFSTSANGAALTSSGALTTAPFSSSKDGALSAFSGYLSETVVLTATGSEIVAFDASLCTTPTSGSPTPNTPPATIPDSGMTLVLLGAGLTALGLFARMRKQVEM